MNSPQIIDARARLRWHQRLVTDASTAFLWGLWLNLWLPVARAFARFPGLDRVARRTLRVAFLAGAAHGGVERYAFALVGTTGTLLLWNRLPAFRHRAPRAESVEDQARRLALPAEEILAGREASVCVVHHDEAGRLVRVEPRSR